MYCYFRLSTKDSRRQYTLCGIRLVVQLDVLLEDTRCQICRREKYSNQSLLVRNIHVYLNAYIQVVYLLEMGRDCHIFYNFKLFGI